MKKKSGIDRREFLKLSGVAAAGLLAGTLRVEASKPTADLVLRNGKIITIDRADSIAEAVAVRNGRIIEIGTTAAVSSIIGHETRVIDLQGKTVTPGLIDSHAHLPIFGQRENGWYVKLQGLSSKEAMLEALAERARRMPEGQWIPAWGVEDRSHDALDRNDLDRVTKTHPIIVMHTSGQWGFANSLALQLSGIDTNTIAPAGSKIEKSIFKREPTGLLIHYPALDLVRRNIPVPTDEQARDALLYAAKLYSAEGVTTVHDNFFPLGTPHFHKAYFELIRAGALPVRMKLWPYFGNLDGARRVMAALFGSAKPQSGARIQDLVRYRRESPDLFHAVWGGCKLAVDGVALWYDLRQGFSMHSNEELHGMVQLFHQADQQVSIHAAGDRAVDHALDALAVSLKVYPRQDHRCRIEHALCPQSRSLERIRELGVVISTHPQWFHYWVDQWPYFWKKQGVMPLRSYLKAGIPVAMGADPPAFPLYQPQLALWQAGVRTTSGGIRFESSESISIREALRIQTMGSAYAAFQENEIGSLEHGKNADMVIWDRDLYAVPKNEIKDAKALTTFLGGKIVHQRTPAT